MLSVSCTGGVDSDAKKAAELMKKSMAATIEYDIEAADEYYKEYKEIKKQYEKTDEQSEFEKAYWKYAKE